MTRRTVSSILCLSLATFLGLAFSTAGCGGEGGGRSETASTGTKAPDFALPDLNGDTVNFSQFKGKVVLVDFWATWCGPCKLEIPHLKELYEQYRDRGFTVIGIALDNSGAEVVAPFVEKYDIQYPILIGNREVAQAFGGVTAIPTAFVIDRSGNVVRKFVGYTEKAVFEEEIKKLL